MSEPQTWPATLEEFWSWHRQAACRRVDTTLFWDAMNFLGPLSSPVAIAAAAGG